jgi:hypothetical protein
MTIRLEKAGWSYDLAQAQYRMAFCQLLSTNHGPNSVANLLWGRLLACEPDVIRLGARGARLPPKRSRLVAAGDCPNGRTPGTHVGVIRAYAPGGVVGACNSTTNVTLDALLLGRGVELHSLTENINTTTPSGKLTFHIFAALAEFERDILRQRVNAGLKAARRRGRVGGRPKALDEADLKKARALLRSGEYSKVQVADELEVSRHTLWRALSQTK